MKKYHTDAWETLCFERPFGIPQKDFFFYPVKPLKIIPFLYSNEDLQDSNLESYKKRIKISSIGLVGVILFNLIVGSII
jgi:hypothetical protein